MLNQKIKLSQIIIINCDRVVLTINCNRDISLAAHYWHSPINNQCFHHAERSQLFLEFSTMLSSNILAHETFDFNLTRIK